MTNMKSMKMGINSQSKDTDLFPTTYEIPIIKIQITSSKNLKKKNTVVYSQYRIRTRIH
jgi:hypothetical protein